MNSQGKIKTSKVSFNNRRIIIDGKAVIETPGPYTGPCIYQQLQPLPDYQGNLPIIGSWLVNGFSAGIGIREDTSPITGNTSRFVPHLFRVLQWIGWESRNLNTPNQNAPAGTPRQKTTSPQRAPKPAAPLKLNPPLNPPAHARRKRGSHEYILRARSPQSAKFRSAPRGAISRPWLGGDRTTGVIAALVAPSGL